MSNFFNHPFHLVNYSPWPLTGALGSFFTAMGLIKWFNLFNLNLFYLGNLIILLTMYQWWRDVCREGTFQGFHTYKVTLGLRWGMILFICSEVFFFVSFFWTFFHSSISPSVELGEMWPPLNIQSFDYLQIPLLNTVVLLSSGISLTWTHHSILENNKSQAMQSLLLTVILGFYFSMLQMYEYIEASFTMSDSVYGSIFFLATGFHGLHVIIGTIFLFVCFLRLMNNNFSSQHHFGFEAAAWYWHFVDVVWLFLYIFIYWWGS